MIDSDFSNGIDIDTIVTFPFMSAKSLCLQTSLRNSSDQHYIRLDGFRRNYYCPPITRRVS